MKPFLKAGALALAGICALGAVLAIGYAPTFKRFMWRAKQVEAKNGLSAICSDQKRFLAANGRYFGPGETEMPASDRYEFWIVNASKAGFTAAAREVEGLAPGRRPAPGCAVRADEWIVDKSCKPRVVFDAVEECTGWISQFR